MKVGYEEAMQQLQVMFADVDREVIHNILIMHKGKVDPTIEDLLKLGDDGVDENSDNLFDNNAQNAQNAQNMQNNFGEDFFDAGGNQDNDAYARSLQEKEDMKLAMALQQKYMAQESQANRQQQSNQAQRQRQPESQGYGNQRMPPQYDNASRAQPYQGEQPYQGHQSQQAQPYSQSQKKPKKSFSQKVQEAKTKFASLFKKKGKKGNSNSATGLASNAGGGYAEIDNLEDQEIISFNNPNADGNFYQEGNDIRPSADFDDVPDLGANPYDNNSNNSPYAVNHSNNNRNNDDDDEELDVGDHEEAKHDFRLAQQADYNRPNFNNNNNFESENRQQSYPNFEDNNQQDPDLQQYYSNKKIPSRDEGFL